MKKGYYMTKAKRYHISPRTGDALLCNAEIQCPFTTEENHFDTRAEAQQAFEDSRHKDLFPEFIKNKITVSPLPEGLKKDSKTFVIPRGVYILGDPSNILSEDPIAWKEWQNEIANAGSDKAVGASYNEYPVVALEAIDGAVLHDSMGRAYSCSSGYIGLVPISLAKKLNPTEEAAQDDGYLLNFNDDTTVEWVNGDLCLGDRLFIKTDPDQELSDDFDTFGFEPDDVEDDVDDVEEVEERFEHEPRYFTNSMGDDNPYADSGYSTIPKMSRRDNPYAM